jgi:hypothetical protein
MWYQSAWIHEPPMRSWVHGDESDTRPGTYYCSSCNSFGGPEHFAHEEMAKVSPRLFKRSMKVNAQRLKEGGWYRPEGVSTLQVPWAVEMRLTEKPPKRRRS